MRRSYLENYIYKIVDCKGEYSLVYEVQPEKSKMERKEEYYIETCSYHVK